LQNYRVKFTVVTYGNIYVEQWVTQLSLYWPVQKSALSYIPYVID